MQHMITQKICKETLWTNLLCTPLPHQAYFKKPWLGTFNIDAIKYCHIQYFFFPEKI